MLSCILSVSMLAGCGNTSEDEITKNVQSSKTISNTQDSKEANSGNSRETIKVTIGRGTTSNPKLPDGDTYEDNAYTRWMEERLNVQVIDAFEAAGEDYNRQVSLAIASGDVPDIMKVGKEDLDELVANDLVEDLTAVYEDHASDYLKEVYDSYEGRVLGAATYDGKLMALPGANVDGAPTMAWIRQDWLDKLELSVDKDGNGCITLKEVKEIAKAFKENDPSDSGNPVAMAFMPDLNGTDNSASFAFNAIAEAKGAFTQQWLQDENGDVYYGTTTPEMKEALGLMHDWYVEGLIDEQYGTRTWDDCSALMVNEQCGIAFGPWHMPDWLLNNVHALNKEAQFTPYAIEDENGKINAFHANPTTAGYMLVRKGFEHPEILVQMANLFGYELQTSKTLDQDAPEVYSYVQNAVDSSTKPWQVELLSATSLLEDYNEYTKCLNGEMSVDDLSRLESKAIVDAVSAYKTDQKTDDSNAWARYTSRLKGVALINKLMEEGTFQWVTPIYPSTTVTMKTSSANLNKLETESVIGFITGSKSLDEFDEFVEKWKAQGGNQIMEEIAATLQ